MLESKHDGPGQRRETEEESQEVYKHQVNNSAVSFAELGFPVAINSADHGKF